jgi:hypothetical protein
MTAGDGVINLTKWRLRSSHSTGAVRLIEGVLSHFWQGNLVSVSSSFHFARNVVRGQQQVDNVRPSQG